MPYKTAVGTTYDSGDFEAIARQGAGARRLRRLQAAPARIAASAASSRARHLLHARTRRRRAARKRGAAVSGRRDRCAGAQRAVDRPGPRQSIFPRLAAERLGIPAEKVTHRHGDSDLELPGMASVGSRSAMTAGSAIVKTVDTMLAKGKTIAANAAGSLRSRHRLPGRPLRGGRHRPAHLAVRARGTRAPR